MTFPKRTFEKPIPISPLIALDRERCILCYRCTRFSEGVAEDGQLVAENRGAQSIITTFEDEPYRAPFSGNVIELCPVGALTSTQYRFEARPWEIQNVPTICGLCPVGCNVDATTREGKVKRIISRNHPEVDEGWLCDKGRSSFPAAARARTGSSTRCAASGPRRLVPIGWDEALDEAETLLRGAGGRIVTALSGSESVEIAYGLGKLLRVGLEAHSAVLPEDTSRALDGFRAPLSTIRDAELVVVIGDDPVVERAPIVDLWIRAARRRGAEVVTIGPHGNVHGRARHRPRRLQGAGHPVQRAGSAAARVRARSADLVGPGRPGRRPARSARGCARIRRQARVRRLPPSGHAERARRRRRLGGGRGQRRGQSGADRSARGLR